MTKDRQGEAAVGRRTLLAGAVGAMVIGASPRRPSAQASGSRLTFAFAPDDSGAIAALLDAFQAAEAGRTEVVWRRMDRLTDAFFRELQSDFLAGAVEIDVFGADVVWTAEMAARDQVVDLTGWVAETYARGTFVEAAARSVTYRNRVWGVPWYTDAGMLYYRRDLLEAAGLPGPPATWDDLARMARTVMDRSGTSSGFVFQGDAYEGGVTNALEFIWSAGGRPWTGEVSVAGALGTGQAPRDPNVVTLNSTDTVLGLQKARELVRTGIAPLEVTQMRERESIDVFERGGAVFMRNWPFAYGILTRAGSGLRAEQIGIATIPTLRSGHRPYSCLGGWNFAIPTTSRNIEAAQRFIRFATQPDRQRMFAERGGFLPSLAALYDDAALREAVPVVALGEQAVRNARTRPASPIYSSLSPRLAFMFQDVLSGAAEPAAAVERTEAELRRIIRRLA